MGFSTRKIILDRPPVSSFALKEGFMSEVFISYSRRDKAFVKALHAKLTHQNRDTWVDWEDIPITSDWWQEIEAGIEGTDTFVFVISPDSVASEVCNDELNHALNNHKRLVPILRRDGFDHNRLHPDLKRHNWLLFQESDDFDQSFQLLLRAIDTDLDYVRQHTRVLVKAIEWRNRDRNPDLLLRGSDLESVLQWLTQNTEKEPKSTERQREYINESRKAEVERRETEIQREKTVRKRITVALVAAVGGLAIATGLGLVAFSQFQAAEARRKQAEMNEINAISLSSEVLFNSNKEFEALIAGLKAARKLKAVTWSRDHPDVQEKVETMLQQAIYSIKERNRLEGHAGGIYQIRYSPDGKTIATASRDKTVKLWNRFGNYLRTFDNQDAVFSVSFSPDSRTIAAASNDFTVKLWNRDGRLIKILTGHQSGIWSVAFSPDSQFIATASADKTAKLWKADGTFLKTLNGHQDNVNSVSFSPDGNTLATASSDSTVRLWNRDGQLLKAIAGHDGGIWDVSFSPDGNTLVTASSDKTVKLWSRDGKLLRTLKGHLQDARSVRFSPNGQTLASASFDKTIRLWSLDGRLLKILQGHTDSLANIAFSPDGKTLASTGIDNTGVLWNLEYLGNLDSLITYSCHWLQDYLTYNPNVQGSDRAMCSGVAHDREPSKLGAIAPISTSMKSIN